MRLLQEAPKRPAHSRGTGKVGQGTSIPTNSWPAKRPRRSSVPLALQRLKYVQPIVSVPSLEASTRALHVLRDIGLSSDLDTQEAPFALPSK